jgi:hypothetical protein
MMVRVALLVAVLVVPAASVRADQKSDEAQARVHFTNGRALYGTGNYDEAMREFALGFDLVQNPVFLLNIGLCHYRLGHLQQARENYLRFLRAVPANHSSRKKGEEVLAQVEHDLAQQQEQQPPHEPQPHEPRHEPQQHEPRHEPQPHEPRHEPQQHESQQHEPQQHESQQHEPQPAHEPQQRAQEQPQPATAPSPVVASPAPTPLEPQPASPSLSRTVPPRKSWLRRKWWVIPVVTVAAAGIAVGLGVGLTRNNVCSGAGACVAIPPQ